MLLDVSLEGTLQVISRISLGTASGNRIHENLTTRLHDTIRKLGGTTVLNYADYRQQLRCVDVFDWPAAKGRENIILQSSDYVLGISRCPGGAFHGDPFSCDPFKVVLGSDYCLSLHSLASFRWILAFGYELAGIKKLTTRIRKTDFWVYAERKGLLFAKVAVPVYPVFAPVRVDKQGEPVAVAQFSDAATGFGALYGYFCQFRHGVGERFVRIRFHPQFRPHFAPDVNNYCRAVAAKELAVTGSGTGIERILAGVAG